MGVKDSAFRAERVRNVTSVAAAASAADAQAGVATRVTIPPSGMPELPQNVDRFQIVRILGKGGMGTVYLARDERLGRSVAVKVLHAEDLATEDRRARFMREARTAASIRHGNVATIYEVGETPEGVPFIVM